MQLMQRMAAGHGTWVRRFEHLVLRLVALAFSLASAHAIRWFFAPLDGVDMDLERQKHGAPSPVKQVQPRWVGSMNGSTGAPSSASASAPAYAQGYQVAKAPAPAPRVPVPAGGSGNGAAPFSPVQVTN